MVSGSADDRIAAVVGPTRRSPAKNRLMAPTVETTARPASQPNPAALTLPGRRSPPATPASVSVAAAPVQTSALRRSGPTRSATLAEVRT